MKILHLGFEDHRRPGSGGGSLRNHQINRRLADAGHDVEVVTARYAGSGPRIEDGVRYRHCGLGMGYFASLLSYQAALPAVVALAVARRPRPDLIVEEFSPPWSSLGIGRWTAVPTVGMVQGYFAAEKARLYHVPEFVFTGVEQWGTRTHTDLIALSEDLRTRLLEVHPGARVGVIGMGLDRDEMDAAGPPTPRVPRRLVFLGRMEIHQKGLDLLLQVCASLLAELDAHLILAGDGRDATTVRELVRTHGLEERVSLPGRVSGADKWNLLRSAQLTVVPSRYETFGLSALESLAVGTPVVGFDIDSLRATVPPETGRLVLAGDVAAFATAVRELLAAPETSERMGRAGQAHSVQYSWDAVATQQEAFYASVVERRR